MQRRQGPGRHQHVAVRVGGGSADACLHVPLCDCVCVACMHTQTCMGGGCVNVHTGVCECRDHVYVHMSVLENMCTYNNQGVSVSMYTCVNLLHTDLLHLFERLPTLLNCGLRFCLFLNFSIPNAKYSPWHGVSAQSTFAEPNWIE